MAKYVVLDASQLVAATIGTYNVSDEQAAVQAVPHEVQLPNKVAVIKGKDITIAFVVDADDDVPVTVQRSDSTDAPADSTT